MAHAFGSLIGFIRVTPGRHRALRLGAGILRAGIFLLGLAVSAVAQSGANYPLVRFTVFAAKAPADLGFAPKPGAAPQKLQFYPTARSPRYDYRGPLPLRILDTSNGQVVAEAAIPPGMSDVLLLLTPLEAGGAAAGGSQLRYQVAVIDDGALRHGPGALAIINLSGLELSGTVGKENLALKSGLNPPVALSAPTKVVFTSLFKGRPYPAYSGMVTLKSNQRALLLLFPPFYKGSLEAQSRLLIDYPPGQAPVKR